MEIAVRYFSKTGRTQQIADAMAEAAGVQAVSVTDIEKEALVYDILFLGGAPYANVMAPELREYAKKLDSSAVKKVVLFTTSNWSRRTIYGLKKILSAKGIEVADETFYAHMLQIKARIPAAKEFAKKLCKQS